MRQDLIAQLQESINRCWSKTGIQLSISVSTNPTDDGGPHVEAFGDVCDIVTTERGQEIERISGCTVYEATRWYVFGMAREHALSAELRDRKAPIDAPTTPNGLKDDGYSRLNWMAPTIEIMHRMSPDFGDWANEHFLAVLDQHPLKDYEVQNARWPMLQRSNGH